MSEAVERLRAANRYDMKLENGIPITYRLPLMQELVIARLLPLEFLEELRVRLQRQAAAKKAEGIPEAEAQAEAQAEVEAVAQETVERRLANYEVDFEAKQRVVALMICTVDGEPAQMKPEDTVEIPLANFGELVNAAVSRTPAGRAEGEV